MRTPKWSACVHTAPIKIVSCPPKYVLFFCFFLKTILTTKAISRMEMFVCILVQQLGAGWSLTLQSTLNIESIEYDSCLCKLFSWTGLKNSNPFPASLCSQVFVVFMANRGVCSLRPLTSTSRPDFCILRAVFEEVKDNETSEASTFD